MSSKPLIDEGMELQRAGKLAEARSRYEQVLVDEPDHAGALHLLGLTYLDEPQWELGAKLIQRAIDLDPTVPVYRYNLGVAYRAHGDFERARICFREALDLNPAYGEAWGALVVMGRFDEGGEELQGILQGIAGATQDKDFRHLHFAAGKIYDDLGDYDRAFEHFRLGNSLVQGEWNPERFRATCAAIRASTPGAFFEERRDWGVAEARPIFIIGMPRSGSSLVEQILSTHPDLAGVGEIPHVKYIARGLGERMQPQQGYPNSLQHAPAEFFSGYGRSYLDETRALIGVSGFRSVDKALSNFLFAGVIRLMFPRAVIIHSARHPLDSCLSCFTQNFTYSGTEAFSSRLDWIADYYRGCRDLVDHWREVLPAGIFDLEYERLVSEPAAATRELLDACGLGWHRECLDFADTRRRVHTASAWQVRQSLYSQSVERWRNYEKHLGPLLELLEYSPDQAPSP